MTSSAARSRTAFLIVGLALPLLMLVMSAAVVTVWFPQLPDPVATHWGLSGPDAFGPAWGIYALIFGVGAGVVLLIAGMPLLSTRGRASHQPIWSPTTRLLAACNLATGTLISFLAVVTSGIQRGLDDAREAPSITGWMLLGLGIFVAVGAVGWLVQPKPPVSHGGDAHVAEPLALGEHERAVWMRTVSLSRAGWIALGIIHAVLLVIAAVLFANGSLVAWIILGEVVLLGLLTAAMLVFRVRASRDGLAVRSALGWPHVRIPASEIAQVRVVDVAPLGDFGGWGYRFAPGGRRGVVLRHGQGLEVVRHNGKAFVVTVDDANTAAAVLAASIDASLER